MPRTDKQMQEMVDAIAEVVVDSIDYMTETSEDYLDDPRFMAALKEAVRQEESNRGEAAEQRRIEEFYGGDGPPTMRQQQIANYEEKRALKNGRNP